MEVFMLDIKKLTKTSHCKHNLLVHIIFVTKYRKNILGKEITDVIKSAIEQVCIERHCEVVACESDGDHIHLMLKYPPRHNISFLVKLLKQRTTFWCWKAYPVFFRQHYWSGKHLLWSDGYFACSTGEASSETIRKYIETQG